MTHFLLENALEDGTVPLFLRGAICSNHPQKISNQLGHTQGLEAESQASDHQENPGTLCASPTLQNVSSFPGVGVGVVGE